MFIGLWVGHWKAWTKWNNIIPEPGKKLPVNSDQAIRFRVRQAIHKLGKSIAINDDNQMFLRH